MSSEDFNDIVQKSGATWDEVRPCVVAEVGGMITVDMSHPQYPRELAVAAAEERVPRRVELRNSIGMTFKLISPGSFMMGSDDVEIGLSVMSPRKVTLTRPFYMGVHEVTRKDWRAVMGLPPGAGVDETYPVNFANWFKAEQFCKKLSEKKQEREAGRRYRLPTEAEWEYACRAGSKGTYCYGDDQRMLRRYAHFGEENAVGSGNWVGNLEPNHWGLFDMHGNVWEWCNDWFDDSGSGDAVDPVGPKQGRSRVVRGGGRNSNEWECASASRREQLPRINEGDVGFRVVLEVAGDLEAEKDAAK